MQYIYAVVPAEYSRKKCSFDIEVHSTADYILCVLATNKYSICKYKRRNREGYKDKYINNISNTQKSTNCECAETDSC